MCLKYIIKYHRQNIGWINTAQAFFTWHLPEVRIGRHLLVVLPGHAGVLRVGIDHLSFGLLGIPWRCFSRSRLAHL